MVKEVRKLWQDLEEKTEGKEVDRIHRLCSQDIWMKKRKWIGITLAGAGGLLGRGDLACLQVGKSNQE